MAMGNMASGSNANTVCSGKQAPQATPAPPGQQQEHTMENPEPIISQMQSAVDTIAAKAKIKEMGEAKAVAATLVSRNEQLMPHIADTAFRDKLHHAVLALKDELNKANPAQASIDNHVQNLRDMLVLLGSCSATIK